MSMEMKRENESKSETELRNETNQNYECVKLKMKH